MTDSAWRADLIKRQTCWRMNIQGIRDYSTSQLIFLGVTLPYRMLCPDFCSFHGGMNLFTIFLAIALALVTYAGAGCTSPEAEFEAEPGGPSVHFELQFQNGAQGISKRHIWIHIPKNYKHDVPAPVILAFHGKGQNVLDFENATNLSNPLVNQDYVVVYPEGLNVSLRTLSKQPLKSIEMLCTVQSLILVLWPRNP